MGRPMSAVAHTTRRALLFAAAGVPFDASAAAQGKSKPPVVTILGDSIAAGLGLPAADALPSQLQAALARRGMRATVRGAGVSGDTTAGALARTDFSVQPDTAVCVIELGGNDFLQSLPPEETERNLRAIIAKLRGRKVIVVLATARLPQRIAGDYGRAFAALYPRVARSTGALLTPDLLAGMDRALRQQDGLHPSGAGVRLIAERLAPTVARALIVASGKSTRR